MPSCALSRRDPPHGKNGFSTIKGFTVIELMMAIAVLAIVTSLALPSYRAIIEKRQVTSGAEQATAFFSTVKSVAVKRNEDIGLYIDPDAGCLGFRVMDGVSCDCTLDVPDAGLTLAQLAGGDYCAVDMNNDGTIVVDEQTTMRATELRKPEVLQDITFYTAGSAAADSVPFVFDSVRGFIEVEAGRADSMEIQFEYGQYALDVWIDRLGRTYVCNPASVDHTPVPGYDSCVL